MHLTPEQKAIGKENFHAAIGSELIRRDLLHEGIAEKVASGKGLGSLYYGYGTIEKPIRVGVLGTGDEGSVLIGAINPKYIEVKAIADIRPYNQYRAFHGDYYSETALAVRPGLMKVYGWEDEEEAKKHVNVYGDYRELLEGEDDLEAVIVALPLHLHAPASIAAMKKGLHVLTEKLMGHSVANCKEMARVAKQQKKHLATGHQRHYNILYDHAVKMIGDGLLGDLHYIRAQWHRGNKPGSDSWQQPMPPEAKETDPQAEKLRKELESWERKFADVANKLEAAKKANDKFKISLYNDEFFLWKNRVAQKRAQLQDAILVEGGEVEGREFKSAEDYGYQDAKIEDYDRPAMEELIRWRLWNRTGGGLMAELGSHQLDAASIFIAAMHGGEKQHPLTVSASASRSIFPRDRDVDDHVVCLYEYAAPGYDKNDPLKRKKRISVAYASINGNGFGGYGETVYGTEGTLLLEREKDALLYKTAAVNDKTIVHKNRDGKKELHRDEEGDPLSAAIGVQGTFAGEISRGYTEELEHWAYCIRNNPDASDDACMPKCHPKIALGDAVIALTTNIAARTGETIEFQEAWFDPDDDATPDGEQPDLSQYE